MVWKEISYLFFLGIFIPRCSTTYVDDPNCLYSENGTSTTWNTNNSLKIVFFIPFNWRFSQILTIELDDLKIILRRPLNDRTTPNHTETAKSEFLETKCLRLGWNVINLQLYKESSILRLKDSDENVCHETNVTKREKNDVSVKGLFSLINCDTDDKYYKISSSSKNFTIPMIFENNSSRMYLHSNSSSIAGITLGQNFYKICSSRFNKTALYLKENKCKMTYEYTSLLSPLLSGNQEFILDLNLSLYNETDYLKSGNYTITHILISNLYNDRYTHNKVDTNADDFFVKTSSQHPISVFYEDIFPVVQKEKDEDFDYLITLAITFPILILIALITVILCGVAYMRPEKTQSNNAEEEAPSPRPESSEEERQEPYLDEAGYDIFVPGDDRESSMAGETFELQNDLYVPFEIRAGLFTEETEEAQ